MEAGAAPTAAIEWKFDTPVMLPRAVLDLVSLREDGRAVLPPNVSVDAGFWSKAFRAYVVEIVSATNAGARNRLGHLKGPIRFDGGDLAGTLPGLGSFAQYRAVSEPGGSQPFLGVRRIARLRAVETQRIAHRLNFWSGRVPLATQLRTTRRELTIRLVPLAGEGRPEIVGEGLYSKGDKSPVAIEVSTARFRELCRLLPSFAALDAAAADWGERVDIKGIVIQPEMKKRFVLQPSKEQYVLKEKQQAVESMPCTGGSSARSPEEDGGLAVKGSDAIEDPDPPPSAD
jgi:hypothetical protein